MLTTLMKQHDSHQHRLQYAFVHFDELQKAYSLFQQKTLQKVTIFVVLFVVVMLFYSYVSSSYGHVVINTVIACVFGYFGLSYSSAYKPGNLNAPQLGVVCLIAIKLVMYVYAILGEQENSVFTADYFAAINSIVNSVMPELAMILAGFEYCVIVTAFVIVETIVFGCWKPSLLFVWGSVTDEIPDDDTKVYINIFCRCVELFLLFLFVVAHSNHMELAINTVGSTLSVKSRVLGNFAHEMRTPLTGIYEIMNELMEDETLDDSHRETVLASKNSSEALVHLIDAVSKISQVSLSFSSYLSFVFIWKKKM